MRLAISLFACIHVGVMTLAMSASAEVTPPSDHEAHTASKPRQLLRPQPFFSTDNVLQLLTSLGETDLAMYLNKTGLAPSVAESAPVTLLAPTNAAFAAASPAVRSQLDHNAAAALAILSYHIVDREIQSSDFVNEQLLKTRLGLNVRINIYPTTNVITASGRPITAVDKMASNGVVHELSAVMLPPGGVIPQVVGEVPDLSTLLQAIKAAGLTDELSAIEPYTLFAPTNQAFQALPAGQLNQLLANATRLREVLGYHISKGTTYSAGLAPQTTLPVLTGVLNIVKEGSMVIINKVCTVVFSDLNASNGVIHLIDSVLFL